MTHPLTPREKVRQIIDGALNSAIPEPWEVANHATDAILTSLASGSGDHAELARLAEWRDRLRADPGRAAHFGSPYADKPMHNGRTYWNSDLAEDITTLIAEVAALRGERDAYFGMANRSEDAWLKAERKLAEAMGLHERAAELMRQCTDPERFEGASTLNVYANMRAWLSDLSKEAERG